MEIETDKEQIRRLERLRDESPEAPFRDSSTKRQQIQTKSPMQDKIRIYKATEPEGEPQSLTTMNPEES